MPNGQMFILLSFIIILMACGHPKSEKLSSLDLTPYGLPLSIHAPDSADVMKKEYNIMRDITIRKGDHFYVQIFESLATSDAAEVKRSQLESVKQDKYFKELILEEENGFIFRKELDSALVDYDFRYIRIMDDKEIIFQTGLIGTFTLEDVEQMYKAVSKK
ncbi:MAG TPA: hypothetical protein VFG10_06070 [Saprospiraceae bacterium]|nr:hypothetical protein [Saprospiraceae bacterium]